LNKEVMAWETGVSPHSVPSCSLQVLPSCAGQATVCVFSFWLGPGQGASVKPQCPPRTPTPSQSALQSRPSRPGTGCSPDLVRTHPLQLRCWGRRPGLQEMSSQITSRCKRWCRRVTQQISHQVSKSSIQIKETEVQSPCPQGGKK
jgi:hypothetical protein